MALAGRNNKENVAIAVIDRVLSVYVVIGEKRGISKDGQIGKRDERGDIDQYK